MAAASFRPATPPPHAAGNADRRMHVMQVTYGMVIGGLERVVMELCRHVDPTRFRLSICCVARRGPLADVMEAEGVPVLVCPRQSRFAKYLRGVELARIFRRHRVDLVHTHDTPTFIDGTIGASLARLPLVHTDHCKQYPTPRRWQVLEREASRFAGAVIAVSEQSRRELVHFQGISPAKVAVIYNGVDLKFGPPSSQPIARELGLEPGDRIIGTAARLEDQKGLDLLIDAAPAVLAAMPQAKFLIVGGGSQEQLLRDRAARRGVAGRVVITGFRTDAIELVRRFECFVQTSHWEGMPMALLEAMALGKPIVATSVGGVGEVVEDGATGLLLRDRDPRRLAELLVGLLSQPDRARGMGERGAVRYRTRFTAAPMIAHYEALYSRHLGLARA